MKFRFIITCCVSSLGLFANADEIEVPARLEVYSQNLAAQVAEVAKNFGDTYCNAMDRIRNAVVHSQAGIDLAKASEALQRETNIYSFICKKLDPSTAQTVFVGFKSQSGFETHVVDNIAGYELAQAVLFELYDCGLTTLNGYSQLKGALQVSRSVGDIQKQIERDGTAPELAANYVAAWTKYSREQIQSKYP